MEQPNKEITIRVQKEDRAPDWLPSKECIEYWQGVLGLLDWNIQVRSAKQCDMPSDKAMACVNVNATMKNAMIDIVPEDQWYDSEFGKTYTVEMVLVHEMLHLHFDVFETRCDTPERLGEEQAVHKLTLAFTKYASRKLEKECHGPSGTGD